ncbi:MAG: acyltransferase, partial [Mesorhizobium sp.]|nr:acyltransferase [Mesorhizobium sp.]
MATRLDFRSDINGLRAVAVVAVVLFHLGIDRFAGGFLGVDVFFVISGYLITGSIVREMEAGRFAFGRFWWKRFRRLFPALAVTVLATMLAGAWLFPPGHFELLGKSAAAALVWVSNVFFYFEAGYFSADAVTKPLLHTWSLGVEEQFYLVWPLVLWAAFRWRGSGAVAWTVAVLFAASLAAALWMLPADKDAVFYWMPFRIFELAIGGLVVFSERRFKASAMAREAVTVAGLAALGGCFLFLAGAPWLAGEIVASLATAAIIHAGAGRISGAVLDNRLASLLGRTSYSLYLVHWPVVVFYRYAVFREITVAEKAGLFVAMAALGWALHEAVER